MGAARRRKAARDARLERALDEAAEIDGAWFTSHPHRNTYIRPATYGEIELHHYATRCPLHPAPGLKYFAVVRQVYPGLRFRQFVLNEEIAGTNVSEDCAADVWETLDRMRGTNIGPLEAKLKDTLTANGRTVH